MDLKELIGPACGVLGIGLTLYIKDKANEAAKAAVKEHIEVALAKHQTELLAALDKIYRRSGESDLMFEMRDDRIDNLDTRISLIEEKASRTRSISEKSA